MTLASVASLVEKRYRPIVYVLLAFLGCAWGVVGAVGKFTDMVDQRALKVVENFSLKPLAEHEQFKHDIAELQRVSAAILASQQVMDHNLTRLMAIVEERRGLPLRAATPVLP